LWSVEALSAGSTPRRASATRDSKIQMLAYLGRYRDVIYDAFNVSDVRFTGGAAASIAEASTDALNGMRFGLTRACT
jgi:hypothetical protein